MASKWDESICSHSGDKTVMWPFAKLLWTPVVLAVFFGFVPKKRTFGVN